MGYRSQVAIAVSKECLEDFLKPLKDDDLDGASEFDLGDRMVYMFDFCKWSASYSDVMRITNSLHELEKKNKNYEFIRVGEEIGDTHHSFSGDHEDRWLGTSQSIFIHE